MTSQSTQNLIGFLTKNSLFKTDNKPKQINSSDTNSVNDPFSRSITPKAKNQQKSQISEFNVFRDASEKQLYKKGISQIQKPSSRALTNTVIKPTQQHRFDKIKSNEIYFSHVKQNTKQQNPQNANLFKSTNSKSKNLFIGFNPPSQKQEKKTFESLQIQAERCLQSMSYRLNSQIQNLTETVEIFNAKMFKMLNTEMQSLKYKVLSMIDEVFKESQKNIKSYIKQQQSQMLSQMISIKGQLENQYAKISQMSLKIKTNEWRKTAAELIGSDMENHVDVLVDKAKHIDLRHPQFSQQSKTNKLHEFSKVLKELAHVQSWEK